MKNSILIVSTFVLTCSSSFAQKEELKELERAFKRNNTEEARFILNKIEENLPNASDDQKAAYYYYKVQYNTLQLDSNNENMFDKHTQAISSINRLIAFENETKSKKYTSQVMNVKNELLAKIVNEAIQNKNANDFKKSSRLFEQAFRLSKSDTMYLYYAASDAVNGRDYDFAESKYKELIALNFDGRSENYVATFKLDGKIQTFGNDMKARDLAVRNETHRNPETKSSESVRPEIYYNLGLILLNKQNYSEAEDIVVKAYELAPKNMNALMNVLMLYYNTNRMDVYEEYAKKGLENFPNNEILLYNLAVIHLNNEEPDQARSFFNRIININPTHFESLRELGNLELQEDAAITTQINALPNTVASDRKREELMKRKSTIYENALKFFLKAQKVNDKDSGLNELITQIQDFLDK